MILMEVTVAVMIMVKVTDMVMIMHTNINIVMIITGMQSIYQNRFQDVL